MTGIKQWGLLVGKIAYRVNRKLKTVSVLLGKPASLLYALIYLFCIPLFALIYWCQPNSFYHAVLRYEESLKEDEATISKEFRKELVKQRIEANGGRTFESNGRVCDLESIQISPRPYRAGRLGFGATFTTTKKGHPEEDARSEHALLELDPEAFFEDSSSGIFGGSIGNDPGDFETRRLFGFQEGSMPQLWIALPRSLADSLTDYASAHEGRPGRTNAGGYLRMLYLSAVTITTLGYGDIVPTTPWARFFTSFEAILGIILVGLFLNALAQEITGSTSQSPSQKDSSGTTPETTVP